MKPAGAKAKGASGERELAALLTAWAAEIGMEVQLKRNLEQVRGGGHDLVGLEAYGLATEVKRVEAKAINTWWAQAVRQAEQAGDIRPLLAWRQNRQPWRFRIRAWIWPCPKEIVIDLEADQFKIWFQALLEKHKEQD